MLACTWNDRAHTLSMFKVLSYTSVFFLLLFSSFHFLQYRRCVRSPSDMYTCIYLCTSCRFVSVHHSLSLAHSHLHSHSHTMGTICAPCTVSSCWCVSYWCSCDIFSRSYSAAMPLLLFRQIAIHFIFSLCQSHSLTFFFFFFFGRSDSFAYANT